MALIKTILCLAASDKHRERCIAGKEVIGGSIGAWIRPVSARFGQEISFSERRYAAGGQAKVLDIIKIPLKCHQPNAYQSENYLIEGAPWEKVGTASWNTVETALDSAKGPLWINAFSSYYGMNDRIPESRLDELNTSLCFIRPDELTLHVVEEGREFGDARRRVRVTFSLSGRRYKLAVTDPAAKRKYLKLEDGNYSVTNSLLCVSLGELHKDGYAYKLAATVITPDMVA